MIEDDLIAAVLADRDDPTPYRVYGDWLESRGDPRGQLVALQTVPTTDFDEAISSKLKVHFIRHPSLTPVLDQWRIHLRWKWGFIESVVLEDPTPAEVRALLEHPSCVLLRQLTFDLAPDAVHDTLEALEQRIPTVESLDIRVPIGSEVVQPDVGWWDRVPRLQQLAIEGTTVVESVRHARVCQLKLEGLPLPLDAVWDLPKLETIQWTDPGPVSSMAPLWRSELPVLRSLEIDGNVDADYANDEFFAVLARLRALSIPGEAFGTRQDAFEILVAHAPRFAHLEALHLTRNYREVEADGQLVNDAFTDELRRASRRALPKLRIEDDDDASMTDL